jgi:hypothetical protein
MTLTDIKNGGITTLTVKKMAQVYGDTGNHFLTTRPRHHNNPYFYSPYPIMSDPARILPVGTTLQILSHGQAQTRYSTAYITVLSSTGFTFDILARDIGRFCQ